MNNQKPDVYSRRERQIMDILYSRQTANAQEVLRALPDPPSYSAVRGLLRVLEEKGHIRHTVETGKNIYSPIQKRGTVAKQALRQVLQTFFGGSVERAVATLLSDKDRELTSEDLSRLSEIIEQAKERREGHSNE